jgi:hypothetical protein
MFALDRGYTAYGAEVERWSSYLRQRGLDRVVLLLIAAQRKGRRSLEVADAFQRVLPIPLSKPPGDLIAAWL